MKATQSEMIECWQLQQPDRLNAIGPSMTEELEALVSKLERRCLVDWKNLRNFQPGVRVLVIRASTTTTPRGLRVWVAGGDLRELAALDVDEGGRFARRVSNVCQRLRRIPIPVVTVIDGTAIGGGAEFALMGDLRLGSPEAAFDFRQLQVGLCTGFGGGHRLAQLIGLGHSQRLLYSAHHVKAEEAYRLGILTHRTDSSSSLNNTLDGILHQLIKLPAAAIAAQKAIFANLNHQAPDAHASEVFDGLWGNAHHAAYIEKYS